MSADPDVIRADGLTKSYGAVEAVSGLTFAVPASSIFGLLGRNGCGKTTTIRLLLGLLWPDAGSSAVFGESSRALSAPCRRRVGYLSEEPFPYDDMPLAQLVRFVAAFFPTWDWAYTDELIRRFELPAGPLATMSAGQRRLAELMLALAPKPDLLVLDDPTQGLDVVVRREFLAAALEVARGDGRAVLLTSHNLTDLEKVVDTVAIMDRGRLLRPAARLDDLKERTRRLVFPAEAGPPPGRLPGEWSRRTERGGVAVVVEVPTRQDEAELGRRFPDVPVEGLNLETLFCELTTGAAAEGQP